MPFRVQSALDAQSLPFRERRRMPKTTTYTYAVSGGKTKKHVRTRREGGGNITSSDGVLGHCAEHSHELAHR